MVKLTRRYPGICRAALIISLDNGGINRLRSEDKQRRELSDFLERQPQEILLAIDTWLAGLSADDIETVCSGEHTEAEEVLRSAPPFADKLLNDYFDEVS